MIVVDDLFVRPFMSIMDAIQSLAVSELYDVDAIEDELKENQLLYELGERDEETYRKRREELEAELEVAEQAHEQLRNKQITVQG